MPRLSLYGVLAAERKTYKALFHVGIWTKTAVCAMNRLTC